MCCIGRPAAASQTTLVTPATSNTQFQPRQRLPATPRTNVPQPRVIRSMSTPAHTPGVPVRPRTPVGTRPARSPAGMARTPNIRNAPPPLVARSNHLLPVPRRTMAPSRIAAIMMRRQYSTDGVLVISVVLKHN